MKMNRMSMMEQAQNGRGGMEGRPVPGGQGRVQKPVNPQNRQGGGPEDNPELTELVEALSELFYDGRLPEDFDMEKACMDPAFAQLLAELPPAAAVRVYAAEQKAAGAEENAREQVSARMRSRGGLPRSQRGGAMASPAPDYAGMSSEAFRSLLAKMKQTARNGGNTRL